MNWSLDLYTIAKVTDDTIWCFYPETSSEKYNEVLIRKTTVTKTQIDNLIKELNIYQFSTMEHLY